VVHARQHRGIAGLYREAKNEAPHRGGVESFNGRDVCGGVGAVVACCVLGCTSD